MWVFQSMRVIFVKPPFLHSQSWSPNQNFANSFAVLNQQTLVRTNHVHCFQTQLIERCLVVWFWISRLDSGLMGSGIDTKFPFYFKYFYPCSRCTARYVSWHRCENGRFAPKLYRVPSVTALFQSAFIS